MAQNTTIGGKLVLEGESEYRAALKNIAAEQKELRSEMTLSQATFRDQQNSLEALEQKYNILTKQIEKQTERVEVYQQATTTWNQKQQEAKAKVEELCTALTAAEKELTSMKENSESSADAIKAQEQVIQELNSRLALAEQSYDKATQKTMAYQTALNNAQAELTGMERELTVTEKYLKEAEESTDKCATSIDHLGKEVKASKDEAINFGDVLKANLASNLITEGLKTVSGLLSDVKDKTIEAAKAAAAYADNINTLSVQTGIEVETLQALTYAEELMDTSVSTVTAAMAKNIRSMDSAREGTEAYTKAYEKLGVQVTDVTTNQLRDSETVFWEVVDALGQIKNETERNSIAMQLFGRSAQQLNTLIETGTDGFQQFKEEAYQAGYILNTDAMTALNELSDAMERTNKRTEAFKNQLGVRLAPELKRFNEIAIKGLDAVDDKLLDLAEGGLEKVSDGLEWILDHSDLVIAGVAGITAAVTYHGAVAPMINAVTASWMAYKKANEAATISQWLLNTAMSANPAGILLTAITALTAGVAAYIIINKDNLSATDEVTKATLEQVEAAKQLNEEMVASAANRKTNRESMEIEAVNCRNLVAELKELQVKTNLTSTEQARMRMIVDELNQAIPDLNLQIDEQTNLLNVSTDALEDYVEAMMALSRAEAAREDLNRIAKEQLELDKQLIALKDQLKEQDEAVTRAEENLAAAIEGVNKQNTNGGEIARNAAQSLVPFQSELAKAEKAQADLEEQINATNDSLDKLASEYEWTMGYISDNETIAAEIENMEALGNAATEAGDSIEEMAQAAQEALTEMYDSVSDLVEGQIDLFSEFNGAAKLSTDELLNNMQTQVEGVKQWSENLETLAERGISQGLLQHLADMGPQGAGYVATFVNMTEEELQKANELYEEALALPDETAEQITDSYVMAGERAALGYISGLSEYKDDTVAAGEEAATETLERTEEILSADASDTVSQNFMTGLQDGINEKKPDVVDIADIMARSILVTYQTHLNYETFWEITNQMCTAMGQGIIDGKPGVLEKVREMCTEIVGVAQTELDINSPSGKFDYMGEMSGEGYKGGWRRSMSNIDSVIADAMPDAVLNPKPSTTSNRSSGADVQDQSGDRINVTQEINIYAATDDPIEAARKFRMAQREAAEEW